MERDGTGRLDLHSDRELLSGVAQNLGQGASIGDLAIKYLRAPSLAIIALALLVLVLGFLSFTRWKSELPLIASIKERNAPIKFWGRVVDQDGEGLSRVEVNLSIQRWTLGPTGPAAAYPQHVIFTDQDGRFMIDEVRGSVLTIKSLSREGYEAEPGALRGFGYSTATPFVPDSQNPVILRMWMAGEHVELVTGENRISMVPDGRSYTLDIVTGKVSPGETSLGDLRLSIWRESGAEFGAK